MRQRNIAIITLLTTAIIYIIFLIVYANSTYPYIGHDFSYFLPRLLDSFLYYKMNGFSIQWYTPTFGGGFPAYPNPQHTQFTLPQLYMLVINPWWATLATSGTFILIGFFSTYYFFRSILKFSPLTSSLGTILFNINGFIFSRTLVGHLGYLTFPLFPILLIKNYPKLLRGLSQLYF